MTRDHDKLVSLTMNMDFHTAGELASTSSKIIKEWLALKFPFPSAPINNFVLIQSEWEDIQNPNIYNETEIRKEESEFLSFYMPTFRRGSALINKYLEQQRDSDF